MITKDGWIELKNLEAFNKLCFEDEGCDYYEALEECEDEHVVVKVRSSVLFQSVQYASRKAFIKGEDWKYSLACNLLQKFKSQDRLYEKMFLNGDNAKDREGKIGRECKINRVYTSPSLLNLVFITREVKL